MRYSNVFIVLVLFGVIAITNCQVNKDELKLSSFFRNINWQDFNKNTLDRNNLSHLLNDDVDFYSRKSFFSFMSTYDNKEIFYKDFFIIEIYESGERTIFKKILVIKNENGVTYLGFQKGLNWSECEVTDKEKNEFRYNELKNGIQEVKQVYLMITKVVGLRY